jgi:crossover junction endodeoxyribonuclease RuvC
LIISVLIEKYKGKIFEYSPNLVKSSTTGHGHASKESIQKFLSIHLGVKEFEKDDESDALAIAVCHVLNNPKNQNFQNIIGKGKNKSIASAVKHKIKDMNL